MNIEQLLDCSAAELRAMTDEQLLAHFEPYFKVTRPELAPRTVQRTGTGGMNLTPEEHFKYRQDFAQLKALGIPVNEKDFLKSLTRKK